MYTIYEYVYCIYVFQRYCSQMYTTTLIRTVQKIVNGIVFFRNGDENRVRKILKQRTKDIEVFLICSNDNMILTCRFLIFGFRGFVR